MAAAVQPWFESWARIKQSTALPERKTRAVLEWEKKWAQVKFLRQGWLENDLSKLFYDVCPNHNNFILSWLYIEIPA